MMSGPTKTNNTGQKPVKTRTPKEERRRLLKGLMQSIGWGNINKTQLAKQWGVKRTQITEDRDALMKEVRSEDISQIGFQLDLDYNKARDELRKILTDPDSSKTVRIRAAQTLMEANDKYTGFLESFSLKEKVADKVQYEEDPATRLYKNLFEKAANKRGRAPGNIRSKG